MHGRDRRREPITGLVLAGASALGAYQVGVLAHLTASLSRALGRDPRFDVLSGTSAGALNALGLMSFDDSPAASASSLVAAWTGLELGSVLRPSAVELVRWLTEPAGRVGRVARALEVRARGGGLLDPRPIERFIRAGMSAGRIADRLRSGRLRALTISATHVATGRAVVFTQAAVAPAWPHRGSGVVPAELGVEHAMASASIPLLFPAVRVDGDLYCDGGLRHMVPLSPALHFGAERLLVVSPVARPAVASPSEEDARRRAVTSPLYLAGKALNAMFADGLDGDLDRLEMMNRVLRAGRARFGPAFEEQISAEIVAHGDPGIRTVEVCHLEPTVDVGVMAAEYVVSASFAARNRSAAARALRCLADGEPERCGDLLSYLLFDGEFAGRLVELGRADARAREDELHALFGAPRAELDIAG